MIFLKIADDFTVSKYFETMLGSCDRYIVINWRNCDFSHSFDYFFCKPRSQREAKIYFTFSYKNSLQVLLFCHFKRFKFEII